MKKSDRELEWVEIKRKHIVQNKWIDFRQVTYRMPDGSEHDSFYTYSRRSYVVIAAEDEQGRMICVRQYRQGIGRVTVEFSAGGIESNAETDYAFDAAGQESAFEAAKRELQEETGYVSDEWEHLLTIPSNAVISDNYAHIYYAKNCRRISDLHLDDTEFLEPELYTPEELEDLIADGTFAQAIHVMAWEMIKNRRKG